MEFTIYRDSWRRGGGWFDDEHGKTYLLNAQNRMCCLGQVCHQAGVPLAMLLGIGSPMHLVRALQAIEYWSGLVEIGLLSEDGLRNFSANPTSFVNGQPGGAQSEFASDAITTNDVNNLTDWEREAVIETYFAQQGHTLKFVDGVAPWFQPAVVEEVVEEQELVCV